RAVAVGSRLRFEAEGGTGSVALRLYDDGVLVAATTATGAGILATGHRGGITGSMEAASDEVAFENVTFGDIDQSTPTPQAPAVTISPLRGALTGGVAGGQSAVCAGAGLPRAGVPPGSGGHRPARAGLACATGGPGCADHHAEYLAAAHLLDAGRAGHRVPRVPRGGRGGHLHGPGRSGRRAPDAGGRES